jgi:hypothetical protein
MLALSAISYLLRCMSPLLAFSGHLELHRTCPLSGVKRILQLNAMMFALHSKELIGLTLR